MRRARHLKRCEKKRNKKNRTNHHDRSYYILQERKSIIELRSHDSRYQITEDKPTDMPWLGWWFNR